MAEGVTSTGAVEYVGTETEHSYVGTACVGECDESPVTGAWCRGSNVVVGIASGGAAAPEGARHVVSGAGVPSATAASTVSKFR